VPTVHHGIPERQAWFNPAQATLPLLPQPWSRCHVPARARPDTLFTDLINSQKALLTATADGAEISAAKHWTDALTSFTQWQMDTAGISSPGSGLRCSGWDRPPSRSRIAGSPPRPGPRTHDSKQSRAYLAQVDLLTKALEASLLDERSKGPVEFRRVSDERPAPRPRRE
jgi:hypothetical protein